MELPRFDQLRALLPVRRAAAKAAAPAARRPVIVVRRPVADRFDQELRAALDDPSSWGIARGKAQLLALERRRRREAAAGKAKPNYGPADPLVG